MARDFAQGFHGVGRVVKEPKTGFSSRGIEYCIARLGFKGGRDGEYLYFDCIAFEGEARTLSKMRRGDRAYVEGKLRKKRDREGLELVINRIVFGGEDGVGVTRIDATFSGSIDDEPLGDVAPF
jgi:hypothetical protein